MTFCTRLVPLDVHHDVLPAERLQLGGHIVGLSFGLLLGNRGGEVVPAVPAHGWLRRPLVKRQRAVGGRACSAHQHCHAESGRPSCPTRLRGGRVTHGAPVTGMRITVKECGGSVSVTVDPEKSIVKVLGDTASGASKEFTASGLAALSCSTLACAPSRAPRSSMRASRGSANGLTRNNTVSSRR